MKKKLEARLAKLNKRYDEVTKALIAENDADARAALGQTLEALAADIEEVKEMLSEVDEPDNNGDNGNGDNGDNGENRNMKVLASMQPRDATPKKKVDPYDSEEYRTAFMNFVCRGVPIPANLREKRDSDAWTTTSDASAVIPTTILKEMVKELKSYGELFNRVRKLNVQGGVNIPILSLKPVATWITADTGTSESYKQEIKSTTSVSFSYFGLECKVAQTLLVNVTTLEMFQQMFVPLATEAVVHALDMAIINGTGADYNQPVGIVNDTRVQSGQKITLSSSDVLAWDEWKKKVFAKIPLSYRNGTFIMAAGTWDGYIDGMVDGNGQPIARVNYGIDGDNALRFGGKEVLLVENDIIKDWDTATGHASTGDVVAVYVNLNDYAINSNLEMQTVKWVDNDTNSIYNKVILICDGKLVDPAGVLIIKKGV